jgi:Flp pilus assembly protein TadD
VDGTQLTYHILLVTGDNLFKEGSLPEALSVAQTAIASDSKRFEGYALAAVIYAKQGQSKQADKALAKALELVPPDKKNQLADPVAYVQTQASLHGAAATPQAA